MMGVLFSLPAHLLAIDLGDTPRYSRLMGGR